MTIADVAFPAGAVATTKAAPPSFYTIGRRSDDEALCETCYLFGLPRTEQESAASIGTPIRPKQNAARPEETLLGSIVIVTTQRVPPYRLVMFSGELSESRPSA